MSKNTPTQNPERLFTAKFILFLISPKEEEEKNTEENDDSSIICLLAEAYAHCKGLITAYLSMGLIIFSFCSYEQQSINEILEWIWRGQNQWLNEQA